jgi:hypothetical protein
MWSTKLLILSFICSFFSCISKSKNHNETISETSLAKDTVVYDFQPQIITTIEPDTILSYLKNISVGKQNNLDFEEFINVDSISWEKPELNYSKNNSKIKIHTDSGLITRILINSDTLGSGLPFGLQLRYTSENYFIYSILSLNDNNIIDTKNLFFFLNKESNNLWAFRKMPYNVNIVNQKGGQPKFYYKLNKFLSPSEIFITLNNELIGYFKIEYDDYNSITLIKRLNQTYIENLQILSLNDLQKIEKQLLVYDIKKYDYFCPFEENISTPLWHIEEFKFYKKCE